jgi:hypothetical protein
VAARSRVAARVSTASGALALLLLGALHLLSPEFDPSWRMVSEYATGAYPAVLSGMFVSWAVSSWALGVAVRPLVTSRAAMVGVWLVFVVGVGEAMAAVFDVKHPLHGLAAGLGIPVLPVAAMLIGVNLSKQRSANRPLLLGLSNLTWVSVALMAASMGLLFQSLQQAGVNMSPDAAPLPALPAGVIAFNGWANRLLIVAYCAWAIGAARQVIHATSAGRGD